MWLLRAAMFMLICVWMALAAGCGTSAPRFRADAEPADTSAGAEDDAQVAAIIRVEVLREDDRKVDAQAVAAGLSSDASAAALDDTPSGISRDKFLLDIIAFLSVPYSYGGTTKGGIDCSGFTSLMYATAGNVKIPRSTRDQYRVGTKVVRGKLRFGDLVFFNTTGRRPSHVGIYLENTMFAHASITDGVTLSSLESTYYRKRFIGARRILE